MVLFWGIAIAIIVFFFCMIVFGRGKLKEFAVYQPNGEVLHLWRRSQSWWFEWGGQMIYQKDNTKNGRKVIVGTHWYLRIEELAPGEWERLSAEIAKKKEQEAT